jgi:cytochrome b561
MATPTQQSATTHYSPIARQFHWITAGFIVVMIPIGLYMVDRGKATNFDALTNTLYSNHKMFGFLLLWIIVARLAYRLMHGAPPDEPTLEPLQKTGSHVVHWALYGLMLAVPLLGWIGVSLFDARGIPFGLSLPALTAKDEKAAETVFMLHKAGAILIGALAIGHVGAALYHHVIRKDGVLRRMMPGLRAR